MNLPLELIRSIEKHLDGVKNSHLQKSVESLTKKYRAAQSDESPQFLKASVDYLGYLATRFPATYATNYRVFEELQNLCPDLEVKSFLDLGAGPGTALWAATSFFEPLEKASLVEKDVEFIKLGKGLAADSEHSILQKAQWLKQDLKANFSLPSHDLVMASYSFNELSTKQREVLLPQVWESTGKILIIVEPGTKVGASNILSLREQLIALGAHIQAPCPHHNPCPLGKDDWCHFYVRLQRTAMHRRLKNATLAFEDEKFSYLIASKSAISPYQSRILRHPVTQKGHIQFVACTAQGISEQTVSKKDKQRFKLARKAQWGDVGDDVLHF